MFVSILIVVGSAVIAALILRAALAWFVDAEQIGRAEGTAGVVMEAMANIYGVLIAFMLAGAWDRYDEVRQMLLLEAAQIAGLQQVAQVLPAPTNEQIRFELRNYVAYAHNELRVANGVTGDSTSAVVARIIALLAQSAPATEAQSQIVGNALDAVQQLDMQHRLLLRATRRPLPSVVWVVLVTGGITVLLLVAISSRTTRTGAGYLALIAIVVSLALYAIYALSYPVRSGFANQSFPAIEQFLTPGKSGIK